jgi:hypothetical protein
MAKIATESKVPSFEVPVARNGTGVDIEACVKNAREVATKYAEEDKGITSAVVTTTTKIMTDEKYAKMSNMSPGIVAKMAIGILGEVPTEKLCSEYEVRVRAFLDSKPGEFIHIERGRNAGYHYKKRLSAELVEKLTKEKATADAKREADAAAELAAAAKLVEAAKAAEAAKPAANANAK